MPVIKSNRSTAATHGAIVLDMGDLRKQADAIIDNAKLQAKKVIEDVGEAGVREAQQLGKDARERGHDEGFTAGHEEGRKQGHDQAYQEAQSQIEVMQNSWQQALENWEQQRGQLMSDARYAILKVVKTFAEKVVHRVIDVDATVIVDQVAEALACVLNPTELRVRICPDDLPVLEESMPELLQTFPNVQHAHLDSDDQIARGGCIVEFGQGQIDATVETQLSRMAKLLIPADTPTIVGDQLPVNDEQDLPEVTRPESAHADAAQNQSESESQVDHGNSAEHETENNTGKEGTTETGDATN